ncbi:MAG: AI-2E family transporter [Clostridia bacterium]|nr:AI-2E family transporter [Clostridia bacterium]
MKKLNERLFTISVYALAVIAFTVLFGMLFFNLGTIFGFIKDVTVKLSSVFYAIILALILLPVVRRLEHFFAKIFDKKKPHPRLCSAFAIIISYLFALILLGVCFGSIIPALIQDINYLRVTAMPLLHSLREFLEASGESGGVIGTVVSAFGDYINDNIFSILQNSTALLSQVMDILSRAASEVANVFLGVMASIYILACRSIISGVSAKLVVAIFPEKAATRIVIFCKRLYSDFCSFAGARILSSICFATAAFLFSLLLNIPMLSVITLVLLLSHMIPVVGSLIGDAIAVVLVLILMPQKAFFYAAILLGLEILNSFLLLPGLMPKKLRPSYALVAALVIISGGFFGLIGAFLAVPLYTTLYAELHPLLTHRLGKKNLPISTDAYRDFDFNTLLQKKSEDEDAPDKEDGGDEERNEDETPIPRKREK